MKRILNAPFLLLPIILLAIGSLYYGCTKNDIVSDKKSRAVKIFESMKNDFNNQGLATKLTSNINDTMSLTLIPAWDRGFTIYDRDSNLCYYFLISGKMNVKTKNVSADIKFENVQRYLIAKKKGEQLEFYQTTVIPQDPTDTRHSFSGDMLVYKLTENKKAIFSYKRGELENGQYYARQAEQSNSQFATIGCLYYHQCTWTSTCDGTFTVVYSRGQGHPTQTLDCGIPQLYQCPGAVWNNTGNGWEVFCNNDPIDPLPPVYPPPTGSGGSGDGGPIVDPIHSSFDDFRYICPATFRFVSVTTNDLWQAACVQNAHCNIKFYDGDSRQYVSRTVEVPNMYFQAPYRDTVGSPKCRPQELEL